MIEKFRNDSVFAYLLENALVTATQLDTMLASNSGRNLNDRTTLRAKRKVSKGAFLRSLSQGQHNIEASFYTLLLLQYLHLLDSSKWSQFVRIALLIDQLGSIEPNSQDSQELLGAMKQFVEAFSRNRKVIL